MKIPHTNKNSFIEQVHSYSITEIPTIFDEHAVQELTENINITKLFILGETHGVAENVDIIYTLFKKFGFRQLALEWEPKRSAVIETYLESGIIDINSINDSQDGRITAGHFALLKKLTSEGLLTTLLCFDEHSDNRNWNERDSAMAQHIINNLSDAPTLVIAGDLHTITKSITFYHEPEARHPMGELIKKEIPHLVSGKITYLKGTYHNYSLREFKHTLNPKLSLVSRFFKNEEGVYIFELPEAHAGIVPNPCEKRENPPQE